MNSIFKNFEDKKKKELQDLLDHNAFSDQPNPGKTNEENFWIRVISFILLFACGFFALAGTILGEYAKYIQYFAGVLFIVCFLLFLWKNRK